MDRVSKSDRSRIMSRIRSKDTKPELLVRQMLHREGVRYRVHSKNIPGTPDISIKKYRLIIDVRGCFWHGHRNCRDGHIPKTNKKFWHDKIERNKARDFKNENYYKKHGFTVFIFWECEARDPKELSRKVGQVMRHLRETRSEG